MPAKRANLAPDAMSDAQLWRYVDQQLDRADKLCRELQTPSTIGPYVRRALACVSELRTRGQQLELALETAGRPSVARAVEDISELLLWAGLEPEVADLAARRVLGIA